MAQQAAVALSRAARKSAAAPTRAAAIRYRAGLWLLLIPFLLGTVVLVGLPAILTFALAFTDFDAPVSYTHLTLPTILLV